MPAASHANSPTPISPEPAEPLNPELLQDVAATFGLLAATVRLHIMWLLATGERDVGSLAEQVGQTVPTVSHHLGKLKLAGLVRNRRAGKRQIYFIDDPRVVELVHLAIAHHRQEVPRRSRRA